MYHPLNKITCPPLDKLNNLARLTLEFSLTQTFTLSKKEVSKKFDKHFADNGFKEAGGWLWAKTALIRPHVMALISLPVREKQPIFDAYLQNQDLNARFAIGAFVPVPIPPVSRVAYDCAAELAGNFYTILYEGVPGEKINEPEELNRQTVLRAYFDAQRRLKLNVCPGCDGKPPSVSDGVVHEDIDHFFPKSKYPFLSIHPLNLTPFCKDCNQSYKGSKDAILDAHPMVADVHELNDIYHPYQCFANGELIPQIDLDGRGYPVFSLNYQPDCLNQPARLHSISYLLGIEARWTGDMDEDRIQEQLEKAMLYGSEEDRKQDSFIVDDAWFNLHLGYSINMFKRGIGVIQNQVPAYTFAKWIETNPAMKRKWLERLRVALKN